MRMGRWLGDGTEDQQATNQKKLNQEKRSHQTGAAPARGLGNQPSGSDGENKDRNSQDLRGIHSVMAHNEGPDDDDVTGYMRCEDAKRQESDHVNHSGDYA